MKEIFSSLWMWIEWRTFHPFNDASPVQLEVNLATGASNDAAVAAGAVGVCHKKEGRGGRFYTIAMTRDDR